MKGQFFLRMLLFMAIGPVQAQADFEGLASSRFLEREKAGESFLDWILKDPAKARDELLNVYLSTRDPELRMRLIPFLERAYFPPKGYVGIQMSPANIDARGLRLNGIPVGKGIRVNLVVPGTPAEKCGLKVKDLITQINGWDVVGGADLITVFSEKIQENPPGQEIRLKVQRNEEVLEISLHLALLPPPSERAREYRKMEPGIGGLYRGYLPASLEAELQEFQFWLGDQIEKDTKSHR